MVNSEKQQSANDREINDVERADRSSGGDSSNGSSSSVAVSVGGDSSLSERVREILVANGDGDLLLQRSDREDNVLQFLQALDMQVMGACRADERLKPVLKLNVATGAAEDRLLAHLIQHFEPAEIGMLARCLCIPLVSIRVGKIIKQGSLLCPTDKRGNLNLALLPTSDMRISFVGDDGHTERLSTLSCNSESATEIEGIPADKSGRSFLVKLHDHEQFYFWCSEKSKLLGVELLKKMKDLLVTRPSLAELTGINESRLDCFAIHLGAYLAGSSVTSGQTNPVSAMSSSLDTSFDSVDSSDLSAATTSVKSSRSRHHGNHQSLKPSSFNQGSLSPRSSSFKEGTSRNLASLRSAAREKFKRLGDDYLSCFDTMILTSSGSPDFSSSGGSGKDNPREVATTGSSVFPPLLSTELPGRSFDLSLSHPQTHVSSSPQLSSPYYCWCPPAAAASPYGKTMGQLPVSSVESFALPSLTSLLSSARSSCLLSPTPPLTGSDFPSLDFPPLLPEPLVISQLGMSSSQQIPTFTPLMCDPIVHIPVIDVCSSGGQGFLVSAGSAMSTTIPPLHANLVNPLIPEAESVVEKGARETLRWLISGSSNQPNSLMDVLPVLPVLPSLIMNSDEKSTKILGGAGSRGLYTGTNIFAAGSRGLYTGTKDVNGSSVFGVASMESVGANKGKWPGCDDFVNRSEEPSASLHGDEDEGEGEDGPSIVREEETI